MQRTEQKIIYIILSMTLNPGVLTPRRGGAATSFEVKVAGWLMPDVRRHLFLLVWVCGVPVHVRYVLHLLGMSAAALEIAGGEGLGTCDTQHFAFGANEPPLCLDEHSLRSAALNVLFAQVAADCKEANKRVQEASLLTDRWAEVRSLSYQTDPQGATRIVALEATTVGEVLALLPLDGGSVEAVYFTAVDQARAFIEQHSSSYIRYNALAGRDEKASAKRRHEHKRPACCTPVVKRNETCFVVVDSDDESNSNDTHLRNQDVVILLDDGGGTCTQTAKRRRKLSESKYELVE